ncbi:MAG: TonB-dependent receptor, partial [Acidobacteria bacterium]|nr:TonB-dependent receptor [Acidobacteriota bacterium]
MSKISSHAAVILFCLVAGSMSALAQTTTATISGTVKDETGAVLPGVSIRVENPATGMTRTALTDDEGRYRAPELAPGEYQVAASLEGFQTTVRSGIHLTVGRHAVLDIILKVGAVDETITVMEEAPLIETTSAALAGLVSEQQIRDLPLNGRNFVQLTLLETGVVQARTAGTSAVVGVGLKMSFHGARMDYNNFMMDGTSINSVNQFAIGGASGQAMGVETIREFQVVTSNFSAEFGRAGGGVINVVTKSGTNEFRGSAFYFHRNDNLDARNFFDRDPSEPTRRSAPPEFKRNQFGFTAGGPIQRDKTFIFGGYEGLREGLGVTLFGNVPSAVVRQGAVVSSVKPYLDLYPLPNGRDFGDGRAEFTRGDTEITRQDFFQLRVDQTFSDADSFFARYTMDDSDKSIPQTLGTWVQNDKVRSQYVTLEEKHIVSATLLNVARFGFNRTVVNYTQTALEPRVLDRALWFFPGSIESSPSTSVSGGNSSPAQA